MLATIAALPMTTPSMPMNADQAGDRMLVERALAGDREALCTIFDRHAPRALRLARRMLAGDAAAAEDAVQEAMLDLARGAARPPAGDAAVASWLLGIVANKCRMSARSSAARRARERAADAPPTTRSPEGGDHEEIVRAVDELREPYRAPLLLHLIEELAPAEVAAALRLPEKTARSQIGRGLELLREALRRRGLAPEHAAIVAVLTPPLTAPDTLARARLLEAATRARGSLPRRRAARLGVAIGVVLLVGLVAVPWFRETPPPVPATLAVPPKAPRPAPAGIPLDSADAWTQPMATGSFAEYLVSLLRGRELEILVAPEVIADPRTLAERLPGVIVLDRATATDRATLERVAMALGYAVSVAADGHRPVVGPATEVARHPKGTWLKLDRDSVSTAQKLSFALSGRFTGSLAPTHERLGAWVDRLQAALAASPYAKQARLEVEPAMRGAAIGAVTGIVPDDGGDPSAGASFNEEVVALSDRARDGASRAGRPSSLMTLLARVAAASGADLVIRPDRVTFVRAAGAPGAMRPAGSGK